MNLSIDLQQAIAEWTETQGISTEEFIEQAIVEKLNRLQRVDPLSAIDRPTENSSRLRRKNGILILETASEADLDINAWIDQLREERIQEQMSL
jgi:hypothetical protein